ncbi:ExbD/TolR family protein [Pararobbsia silviterrae]|uniref:Biopolymer transporter ExbD n=1 Tax=Pararobbsia silviterrae TaxID=1792498 RepID=A0A494X8P7_9BURK|nr:biopolymer transporter ExbD [Pararobbsia silviterrae]RKP47087.1 biopolymer transporter ExbD [Pararobbsia silviterrae]
MGMNVSSGDSEPDVLVDINTTPLIDVMLVLLIMLIITIPIQMHSVKMDLPVGNPPPSAPPPVVQINVGPSGEITWDGTAIASQSDLDAHMAQVAAQATQPELHLFPDNLAPYRFVAQILASAQRAGATNIGVVGNERYMQ